MITCHFSRQFQRIKSCFKESSFHFKESRFDFKESRFDFKESSFHFKESSFHFKESRFRFKESSFHFKESSFHLIESSFLQKNQVSSHVFKFAKKYVVISMGHRTFCLFSTDICILKSLKKQEAH